MTEAQKTLYYIAENMKMDKSISEEGYRHFQIAIKALEQESILDKIYCTVYPLSIMSTPELEHKAIMQIAEMLEPLCLPESEDKE